ncbi:MAG: tetratricopeptide repeat protein, partial [Bdellovibrionales bacterium]
MLSGQGKKWIIKNAEGLLKGPYSTEDILNRISRGDFSGEELISEYPGANWYPISQDPHFYDRLLDVLSRQGTVSEEQVPPRSTVPPKVAEPLSKTAKLESDDLELDEPARRAPAPPAETHSPKRSSKKERSRSRAKREDEDIELVDVKKKVKRQVVKGAWKPAVVALTILAAGLYLLMDTSQVQEERIHLLAPRTGQSPISPEQSKAKVSRGVAEYLRDTFAGYNKAQNELVQVVEGAPGNAEVLALLCLTYYELWPYAFQDSADMKVISQVTQAASIVDGPGMHAATCKVVDLLLKGRYGEARSLSNSVLEAHSSGAQPPIPFYYFMSILSDAASDTRGAIGFLTTAQGLWPQWLRVFIYQAQLNTKIENYTEAARIYRSILQASPSHDVVKIELGLLEYKHFRNLDRGAELIQAGLQTKDRLQRKTMSRGYLGLAEIYLQRRNTSQALGFARKAYQMDSTNSVAKNLVVQLGGAGELGKTRFKAYQLIAEGDQFFREGDC